jgi:hypothetical protein
MKRAVLYLRVSARDQTTANQEHELREIAGRMGCKPAMSWSDVDYDWAIEIRSSTPMPSCVVFDRSCAKSGRTLWALERLPCDFTQSSATQPDVLSLPLWGGVGSRGPTELAARVDSTSTRSAPICGSRH